MNTKKKILILGANGFLGRHMAKQLNVDNYQIVEKTKTNCDLLNIKDILEVLEKETPSIIINCAGIIGSSENNISKNQYDIFKINIQIIFNLLDAIKQKPFIEHLYLFSSYRCFSELSNFDSHYFNNFDIESLVKANNCGYLTSKFMMDIQIELFLKFSNTKITNLIIPNLYGEFDNFCKEGRIVPSLVYQIYNINYNKQQIWNKNIEVDKEINLLYVKDLIAVIKSLVEEKKNFKRLYVENNNKIYISDLINKIVKYINPELKVSLTIKKREISQTQYKSNIKEILPSIKFTNLDDNLQKLISYFIDIQDNSDFL